MLQSTYKSGSTWAQAGRLWLLTNAMAAVGCGIAIFSGLHDSAEELSIYALLIIGFALVGSLPAIPLAKWSFGRVLLLPQQQRLWAGAGAIVGLCGAVLGLLAVFTNYLLVIALAIGGCTYIPAALLAAALVYKPVLRQSPAV